MMKSKLFDLTGRTALVTGASGLLGIEHSKALLSIGARVILTDINLEDLINTQNILSKDSLREKIDIAVMDVTSEDSITQVASDISDKGLRVDILINNAAINPTQSSISEGKRTTRLEFFSLEDWNNEIAVGLTGAFLCSKIFGSAMASDGIGGVILNISSDLSVIAPDQNLYYNEELPDELQAVKPVTYSVVKTGLVGLTRYLSTYWADKGVRANALSPGGVFVDQDEQFMARLNKLIPLGRMAAKNEYHGAVQFLCSDASAYMNGQNIVIDGGRSVL